MKLQTDPDRADVVLEAMTFLRDKKAPTHLRRTALTELEGEELDRRLVVKLAREFFKEIGTSAQAKDEAAIDFASQLIDRLEKGGKFSSIAGLVHQSILNENIPPAIRIDLMERLLVPGTAEAQAALCEALSSRNNSVKERAYDILSMVVDTDKSPHIVNLLRQCSLAK